MKLNKTIEPLKNSIAHLMILCISISAFAQKNQDTLTVLRKLSIYKQQTNANDHLIMLELKSLIPSIQIDLRYATVNNFTHVRLYPSNTHETYMRKDAAFALANVSKELKTIGLGIKVWDAYRPYSVTQKFWNLIHDERYVANPSKGSGHNRGIAIDMTLYDLKSGKEIEMPTGFDDFSEAAHHGYMQLDENKIRNRELLKSIMIKYGFNVFGTEWWHYSWPNSQNYPVLDIPFNKIGI
jgi:D-alanyl-D-alanine dipeptidase